MSGQAPDPTGAKILDAAARVLTDFGFKRATVELVAKYAGVSHMTVYRRWSSKNELLRTAALRELSNILDNAFSGAGVSESFREQVLDAFADTVWSVYHHPLMRRELDTDRDALLPLMSPGSGAVMESVLPQISERLQRLAAESDIVVNDPDALADVFVRLAHSLLLLERTDRPLSTRSDIADYAQRALGPLAASVAVSPVTDLHAVADEPAAVPDDAGSKPLRTRPRLHLAAASLLVTGLLGGALLAYPVEREFTPTDSTSVSSSTPAPPPSPLHPPPAPPAPPSTSTAANTPVTVPPEPVDISTPSRSATAPSTPTVTSPATKNDPRTGDNTTKPSPPRRPPTPPALPPKPPTMPMRPPPPGPGALPPPPAGTPPRIGPGAGGPGGLGPH